MKSPMRRINPMLGVILGLALVLGACGDNTATTAPAAPPAAASAATTAATSATTAAAATGPKAQIKIMVGGLSKQIYLANMLAKQLGFFDQNGLDVTLIDEASGQSSEQSVLTGQVDAGS